MSLHCSGSQWFDWVVISLVAFGLRAGVLLLGPGSLDADPDGYRAVGENLIHHGVLGHGPDPSAIRPPLYPLVLAACALFGPASRWALALVHLLAGLATVWLAWDLAQQCRLGRLGSLITGLLVACDPILLGACRLVMTETLAAMLATAGLNLWCRWLRHPTPIRAGLLGALLALGVLCRPEWMLWVLAVAVMLLTCFSGLRFRFLSSPSSPFLGRRWTRAAHSPWWASLVAYGAAVGIVLAPWAIRNAIQLGRPLVTTTHGGYTLLLANNPWLYEHLQQGGSLSTWNPQEFHQAWAQTVQEGFARPLWQFRQKSAVTGSPPDSSTRSTEKQTPVHAHWPPEKPLVPALEGPSEVSALPAEKPGAARVEKLREPPEPAGPLKTGSSIGTQEILADLYASHQAIHTIRENPGTFCRAVFLRWGRLWQLAPHRIEKIPFPQAVSYGILVWYGGEFLLAIWGTWVGVIKKRANMPLQKTLLLALLEAGLLTGVHALYWTDMRMRASLTSGIALASAVALRETGRMFRPTDPPSDRSTPSEPDSLL